METETTGKGLVLFATLPCPRLSGAEWATDYVVAFPSEKANVLEAITDLKKTFRWLAENLDEEFFHKMESRSIISLRSKASKVESEAIKRV